MPKHSNSAVSTQYLNYQSKRLAYQVAGAPAGKPIFINYGLLGSVELPQDLIEQAISANIKLIMLERPGYGSSDFIPMKSYLNWCEIVAQLLDELEVSEFGVIGISAGAPYAYALAHGLANRLTGGVYILNGVPNIQDKEVYAQYPNKARDFYDKIWQASLEDITQEMKKALAKYTNFFFKLILPKQWKLAINESLKNNGIGLGQTVKLQVSDWGFDLYALEKEVHLWHAKKDPQISFMAVKKMVQKMPNAKLHIQPKNDHEPSEQTLNELFELIKKPA